MARVGTPNLNLGTYVEGENPGAGSQTVDSDGLNGDRIKVDTALGAGHTAAGAHKANVIGPTQLAVSVVDGVTLTGAGGVVISVLNDGITGAKIAAAAVDNSTLEASAATGAKTFRVKDAGITGAKLNTNVADGATIEKSGSSLRVMDDGITAPKISHNNNRTKAIFSAICDSSAVNTFAKFHGVAMSATLGISMPRAGAVTRMQIAVPGSANGYSWTYGTTAPVFGQNDRIYFRVQTQGADQYIQAYNIDDAAALTAGYEAAQPVVTGAASIFIVMEVEFDD